MISEFENILRRLVISMIGDSDDSNYKVSPSRIEKWKVKREIERKKNNGILYEKRILFYSDFYDLETIIDKNWELFKPILKDKKRFFVFFKEISQYRNTIAHGRSLIKSQKNLLSGILKDLKNQITQFHNINRNMDDYFIEILNISDNLGNSWGKSSFDRPPRLPILRVDDEYELLIDANDPKDREIQYEIKRFESNFKIVQKENRFTFKINESMIGRLVSFRIIVSTPKSEYINRELKDIHLTILPKN